jgi:hypothetical protein
VCRDYVYADWRLPFACLGDGHALHDLMFFWIVCVFNKLAQLDALGIHLSEGGIGGWVLSLLAEGGYCGGVCWEVGARSKCPVVMFECPFCCYCSLSSACGGGRRYLIYVRLGFRLVFRFNVFLFTLPTALVSGHTRMELWQSDDTAFGGCLGSFAFVES